MLLSCGVKNELELVTVLSQPFCSAEAPLTGEGTKSDMLTGSGSDQSLILKDPLGSAKL